MARVAVIKKDSKPVVAKVTTGGRGMGRGPRNGTGPRARVGVCPRVSASDQIALACRRR